ncbi:adenine phosphoribosyltransferase [Desulfolucanica intricata]|uniref:adenine phosphoribosyltransferase n=1 Tax=Desulfolucanica intricata TaxID=1285191 RepID=UPI0008348FE8|nr:adenine phosphoribosyltransferase [Desulfolucanica intricata]
MNLKDKIRVVPDYPQEGISYKDVSTFLRDSESFRFAIQELSRKCANLRPDVIATAKARGLMIGAPMAYVLGVSLVTMSRPGQLAGDVFSLSQDHEFGSDAREVNKDAIKPGERVLIVDELLATGSTAQTAIKMVEELGGIVVGTAFLIEITELGGRDKLKDYDTISLVQYNY